MSKSEAVCKNCIEWEDGIRQISGAQSLAYIHGVKYTAGIFRFCPWCGAKLVNEEARDDC